MAPLNPSHLLLPLLSALATTSILIFIQRSSYALHSQTILSHPHLPVPETLNNPLEHNLTPFAPLNLLLSRLNLLFLPALSGQNPALSLQLFHFITQIVPAVTILLRLSPSPLLFTLALLLSQVVSVAVAIPLFCASLLIFPRHAPPPTKALAPSALKAIPWAVTLGFTLPSALVVLGRGEGRRGQALLSVWQGNPLLVYAAQKGFAWFFARRRSGLPEDKATAGPRAGSANASARAGVRQPLYSAYTFACTVGTVGHVLTLTLILASQFLPSSFPPRIAPAFTLSKVFAPPNPWAAETEVRFSDAALGILQLDEMFCFVSLLVFAVLLGRAREQGGREGLPMLPGRVVVTALVCGPGTALVMMVWGLDEKALKGGDGEGAGVKEKRP